MRWRRAPDDCVQCGVATSRDDRWCGSCGALLAPAPVEPEPATVPAPPDPEADASATTSDGGRVARVLVAMVLATALGLGVLMLRPAPVGSPRLGHLDVASGTTSTAPPPTGLRVAWAHGPEDAGPALADVEGHLGPLAPPVVRGGRALLGGLVFDLDEGQVLADLREAWPVWGEQGQDGVAAVLGGGELAVVDLVSGHVRRRTPVDLSGTPLEGMYVDGVARAQGDGLAMFSAWSPRANSGYGSWAVLDWEGRLVAHGEGSPHGWFGAAPTTSDHTMVVTPPDGTHATEMVRVIELATGRTALQRPVGPFGVDMDVDGDRALVVTELDSGAGRTTDWDVQLLDLPSGETVATAMMQSTDRPTLLGTTDDGRAVVGTRTGETLRVDVLGSGSVLERVLTRPVDLADFQWFEETVAGALAAVHDDKVITTAPGSGVVEVVDLAGRRLWHHDAGGAVSAMAVGDGHVALALDRDSTRRLRLLRIDDGSEVLRTVAPTAMSWSGYPPEPLQVDDGLLAVRRAGWGNRELAAIDWLELRDGRERDLDDAVRRWRLLEPDARPQQEGEATPSPTATAIVAADDDGIDTSTLRRAELLGVLRDDSGRDRTVVAHVFGGELRLLLDDRTMRIVDLPADAEGSHVVGAAAGRIVVSQDPGSRDGAPRIVLADLDGGTMDVVDDLHPWRVVGGVVLAVGTGSGPEPGGRDLIALDVVTAEEAWRRPGHGDGWQPSGDERQVVLVHTGRVTAVDTAHGTESWSAELDRLVTGGPAVLTMDRAVVHTPYGEVVALDRDDGEVVWRTDLGRAVTSLSGAGDHVLVGTGDGLVVHLDAAGRELERVSVGTDRVASVAALGETVVAVVGRHVVGLRTDGNGITRRDEVELP